METTRSVPILITWDVDPDLWMSFDRREFALKAAIDMCKHQGIRATFFVTAGPAGEYVHLFRKMQAEGHEIGCHGLTHGIEENYDRMQEDMQRHYIEQATQKLQDLIQTPVRAFRSPRVKTSAYTLKLLAENGYWADSSVCSQRADLVSSNLLNPGWIFAPRRPYHPHEDSAFRQGDVAIWEIPISAAVVPFISSSLHVLGLSAMKMLFRLLYAESRRTGKPIVYLAHPTDFAAMARKREARRWRRWWKNNASRQYLTASYIRAHGLRLRNLLYHLDAETRLSYTKELFSYIGSFANATFMTISGYTASLFRERS